MYARSSSNGAIWNEFSEQHQHQSTKKKPISNAYFALFVTKGMHILVGPKDIYFGKTTQVFLPDG